MKQKFILFCILLITTTTIQTQLFSEEKEKTLEIYRGQIVSELLLPENYPQQESSCRVFLVRHGETDWNVQDKPQGWEDVPLNDTGKAQADQLGYYLSELPIAGFYTSVLSRAVETTARLAQYHPDSLIIYDPSLRFYDPDKKREHSKLTKEEVHAAIALEVTEGVTQYLKDVYAQHKAHNIVLITHGSVIKHLVTSLIGEKYNKIKIDNAAIVPILVSEEGLSLEE